MKNVDAFGYPIRADAKLALASPKISSACAHRPISAKPNSQTSPTSPSERFRNSNKAIDRLRRQDREAAALEKFAAEPITISEADWRRETFNIALRRVFAYPTIRESSKIAFRRVVQQGEDVATVARNLGLEPNAIYQIWNRLKERLQTEVRQIQESDPDGI